MNDAYRSTRVTSYSASTELPTAMRTWLKSSCCLIASTSNSQPAKETNNYNVQSVRLLARQSFAPLAASRVASSRCRSMKIFVTPADRLSERRLALLGSVCVPFGLRASGSHCSGEYTVRLLRHVKSGTEAAGDAFALEKCSSASADTRFLAYKLHLWDCFRIPERIKMVGLCQTEGTGTRLCVLLRQPQYPQRMSRRELYSRIFHWESQSLPTLDTWLHG